MAWHMVNLRCCGNLSVHPLIHQIFLFCSNQRLKHETSVIYRMERIYLTLIATIILHCKNFHFHRISFFVFVLSVISHPSTLWHDIKGSWLKKETEKCKQTTLQNNPRSLIMMERSPTVATYATTQAIDLAL